MAGEEVAQPHGVAAVGEISPAQSSLCAGSGCFLLFYICRNQILERRKPEMLLAVSPYYDMQNINHSLT